MRKKGLSPVVATIAIILVTVGAVSFIAGFLVPYFKTQLNEGTECVDYREYFTFDDSFGFNCYEAREGFYLTGVSVRANSAPDRVAQGVKGFELLFFEGAESKKVTVENGLAGGSLRGETKLWNSTASLAVPEEGGVRTYVYNSSERVTRVEIFPVLKENDRQCDKSAEVEINLPCTPIGILV